MELNYLFKNKGFSLLELIITVAILSIGIVAVIRAVSYSVRMTALSCDMIDAVFLAEDKMQELEFKEKQNFIKDEPWQMSDKKNKFEWGYVLKPDPDSELHEVGFFVSWKSPNRVEGLRLYTYIR